MKSFLTEGFTAIGHGTGGGSGSVDAVDAGGTHFVVAFWIDEELEGGVEVAV